MNVDGSGVTTLVGDTPQGVGAGDPSWSPDGSQIAFLHYECWCTNNTRISDHDAIVNADGTGEHRIPNTDPEPASGPAWSPDGQWIVHARGTGLAKIRPDGSGRTTLTPAPSTVFDLFPDWQPIQNLGLDPYPRPGGATPLRAPLVPAYAQCATADQNSNHVSPLALDSCSPPTPRSLVLTTSPNGAGSGFARLTTIPGVISTPADEADVRIEANVSDVRNASDGSDYTGKLLLSLGLRMTDKRSGFGGVPATVADAALGAPLDCVATPTTAGADCSLSTTADTLLPSLVLERKRTILSLRSLTVDDAGVDGNANAAGCPRACGTGDERPFLDQGVFAP
jgi:dipeptidyl aminopeptidase/acylaminoacyl peptidase